MSNRLLIIILIFLLLVILVGGGLVYVFVLSPRLDSTIIHQIPELFVTDLVGRGHVKVEVYVQLGDKKLVKDLEEQNVEAIDAIYRVLRNKSREDLTGANGQDQLREELLDALRTVLDSDKVLNLYFKQIVIT